MKILFINSSPRQQGNLSQMVQLMQAEAETFGIQTQSVNTTTMQITPCKGCMSCRKTNQCCLATDDAHHMAQLLHEADALVIAAPCYWGNMPGTLKLLFDRMVYALIDSNHTPPSPLHKGKTAIILTTCTTAFPLNIWFNQSRGTIKAIKEVLRWSGFKTIGILEKTHTHKNPQLTPKEKEKCRKMIHKICRIL